MSIFSGFGKKVEQQAADHYREHLAKELAKDGCANIPGIGHGVLDMKCGRLLVDLDTGFLQRIRRTGNI